MSEKHRHQWVATRVLVGRNGYGNIIGRKQEFVCSDCGETKLIKEREYYV